MESRSQRITLRNVSPELARKLKNRALLAGTSLNSLILNLLEEAMDHDQRYEHLKQRYATWTQDDFEEFQQSLAAQRMVDDALWQ